MYAWSMWCRREKLGLGSGSSIPGWREVKRFVGAGGAMIFRQVGRRPLGSPCMQGSRRSSSRVSPGAVIETFLDTKLDLLT